MLIDLEKLPVDIVPHMRDGEKEVHLKKWSDGPVKVLQGKLPAGASIGLHTHTGNCEIIHVLSGSGVCHDDGTDVPLTAGMTHYCPEGHTHGIDNTGAEPLVLLGILPDVK